MLNPEDISDPINAMNMALVLMDKAFKLNYSTPTNNNQRISSNPHNWQIAQPGINMGQDRQIQMIRGHGGNQVGQLSVVPGIAHSISNQNANQNGNGNVVVAQAEGNANRNNGNQIRCYNCRGLGHYARNCTVRPRRRDAAYLQTQLLIAQKEVAGIQLQAKEFDLMAAAGDIDEIEDVNANCVLMANLQQASTSGIQIGKAPVYDSDGTSEDDSNVILDASSVEQRRGTVDQNPATAEEIRAHIESLYNNLAIEVERFNMVNCKVRETNADLTIEPARYKSQEKCFEINQEKYGTLKKEFENLNNQLSKEKSNVSNLQQDNKQLKSDFKIRKDKLLDKQIELEKKIKELDNILVKHGHSVQTMHMLTAKPDSFYYTEQKMALGYPNPHYLKQAQQKQESLCKGKVLLEKHDPHAVYDSEEILQLAQESQRIKQRNKTGKLCKN
uniref:CCHC-type domain-containing protein n=1 Tax=Tanacetum cinerariifolium TaxID=118510 RepID=A0A6L2JEG5_TANCI|nr:hypothetical protein [Tanacetum cinerariifolium]